MKDNMEYNYFGNSIESSLKDQGMVCRKEKSDQYYFIYKVNEAFEEGFISENEILDFMNGETGYGKKEIMEFIKNVAKTSFMEFTQLPILEKVYKLSQHFGVEVMLGKAISGLTYDNALNIIENE